MSIEYSVDHVSEVEATINRMLTQFPAKFKDVNRDDIKVIFRDSLKSPWRATVKLVTGLLTPFVGKKVALLVWKGNWEGSDDYQRSLMIYEQLMRIQFNDKTKKYTLRKHDVQTFSEILQDFGLNYEKAKEVFDQAQK